MARSVRPTYGLPVPPVVHGSQDPNPINCAVRTIEQKLLDVENKKGFINCHSCATKTHTAARNVAQKIQLIWGSTATTQQARRKRIQC